MNPIEAAALVLLEGVIVPVAWQPAGEAVEFGLMTFDEAEYRIIPGAAGDFGLREYLRKRVRILAVIRSEKVIEVRHVEVVESSGVSP